MEHAAYVNPAAEFADSEDNTRKLSTTETQVDVEKSITCFERHIPSYAGETLERLYSSVFSSVDLLSIYGALDQASAYVVRQGEDVTCLLLYRRDGRQIRVLNECIELAHADIEEFCRTMFKRHPDIDCVLFNAVRVPLQQMSYPVQRYHWNEDIVAELPDTVDAYASRLSKNMRQITKYYMNRVRRLHPSFRFQTFFGDDIDERVVQEIYRFNRQRMESKQVTPNVPDDEIARIMALARRRGFVMAATIDGQVCGGLVFWRIGGDVYLRSISHDPRFDDLNIGTICCHLSMIECIAMGAKRFHFLWGRLQYKYRFLGKDRNFDRIVVYRSRLSLARQTGMALRTMKTGAKNELNLWLFNAENRDDPKARTAQRLMYGWRLCKKLRARLIRR